MVDRSIALPPHRGLSGLCVVVENAFRLVLDAIRARRWRFTAFDLLLPTHLTRLIRISHPHQSFDIIRLQTLESTLRFCLSLVPFGGAMLFSELLGKDAQE